MTSGIGMVGEIELNLDRLNSTMIVADRRRIAQVIRNLADNALPNARQRVWIEVRDIDGSAELVVADDGPGIPPAHRQLVFERFVRLDTSRSRAEGGTGLGLAVVQAFVQAHGGSVEIVDDHGYPGAVVRVRLPSKLAPRD